MVGVANTGLYFGNSGVLVQDFSPKVTSIDESQATRYIRNHYDLTRNTVNFQRLEDFHPTYDFDRDYLLEDLDSDS